MLVVTRTILSIPEALGELVAVAFAIACVVAVHAVLQRRLHSEVLRRHNDVAGYLFSVVGVLYAVLLGFVVVVVWEKYDATVANVEEEVAAAADLYHSVEAFPAADRVKIRSDIRRYAEIVIRTEWPDMAGNVDVSDAAANVLEDASYRISMFSPPDRRADSAQRAAIANVQRLFDARRQRLIRTEPSVPMVLWFALYAGALAVVSFCYIFGVENRPTQLLMTAILVGLIAILFVVIGEFAGPFSGSVSISSDGWVYMLQRSPYLR